MERKIVLIFGYHAIHNPCTVEVPMQALKSQGYNAVADGENELSETRSSLIPRLQALTLRFNLDNGVAKQIAAKLG